VTSSPSAPERDNAKFIWIGIIVVVVALGIVALVVARGSGSDGSSSSGTTKPADCSGSGNLPQFESSDGDTAVCRTIPKLSGDNVVTGKPMSISADGSPKVIMFVAHWCPHCQREVPVITQHLAETGMPKGVDLVAVSTGVQPEAPNYPPKAWLKRVKWPVPTMADTDDSAGAQAYGLSSYPYFVAVDKDGKVVYRTSGELSIEAFDALVDAARTGTAPA
jgi:thiol-disulfide isomerase/thioredoxin